MDVARYDPSDDRRYPNRGALRSRLRRLLADKARRHFAARSIRRALSQVAVEDGLWFADGLSIETITGCTDIDLEWSPSTNTLPIRRLPLAVGERSGPIVAAWVRFPSIELQPLSQEYQRTAGNRYRYVSNQGAFVAELAVDEEGLVTEYEGLWRRETAK